MSPSNPSPTEAPGVDPNHGTLMKLGGQLAAAPALAWPYSAPARPEILTAKPNPSQLLHALRRRRWLAVGLGILVAVACSGLAWLLVPVSYEASAMLHVAEKEFRIIGDIATDDYQIYRRAQAALIKDPFVISAALLDPEISQLSMMQQHKEDPVGWLSDQLIIDYPGDATYMRIAIKGDKPVELAKLVNAVKDAYLNEGLNRERLQRTRERDSLEQSLQFNQTRITEMLRSINDTSKRLGTTSSDAAEMKKRAEVQQLDDILRQRASTLSDIRELKLTISMFQGMDKDGGASKKQTDQLVDSELSRNQQIQRMEDELAKMKDAAYDETLRSADPNSKNIKYLRQRITAVEESIEDMKSELRPAIEEQIKASGEGTGRLDLAKRKLEELEKVAATDKEELAKLMETVGKIDQFSADLITQKRELDALQKITDQMDQEMKMWEVDKNTPPRVSEVRAATPPSGNNAMRKYMAVAFAGVVGFCVVVFCVSFFEFQARRLNARRDVSEGLGLRVLGELPSFSGRGWRRGSTRGALQAALAESIDSIRTALIHAASATPPRVVMVTSAEPREGKTTVASQLAGSLARAGRKTLYIDGDLRNAAAHRVFELPQEPGLCEMLRGEVDREAVLQPTRAANLWLLAAGRCDARSVQALSSNALTEAINALRSQFDFIVIDSGPVLTVADPLLLGQHVDAAILSVLRDVSRVPGVYEATDRLRSVGINLMGVVVNGVSDGSSRHGYELQLAESA